MMEYDDARRQTVGIEVSALPSFVFVDDGTPESHQEKSGNTDPLAGLKAALRCAMDAAPNATIGIQKGALPAAMLSVLDREVNNARDCTSLVMESRLIKTPWEIDMLRMAAQHSERMQARVCQQLEPGMNAMILDKLVQDAGWEEDSENSISFFGYQLGIGPYWGVCMAPRNYAIEKGDLCRIDGGAQHLGYISDISRTWAVGGSPGPKHVETHAALYAGFQKGIEMLRPGVKMSDLYAAVRAEVEKSPLIPCYARGHVGHSISVNPFLEDNPKFAPHVDVTLQPGMVVCLETSYMGAAGAPAPGPYNIEDSFAITEDGHERFTTAPDSLEWDGSL
jgi:Xaa-Pro aminopeptidase